MSQYANYDFIAVLGLIQRLHIPLLPITWQEGLGQIGEGGSSKVFQALVNVHMSFAFKRFHHPQSNPFQAILQELVVLSHPVIQKHEHIVRLEGIYWDIPSDHEMWPVLVFQKARFGDLWRFGRSLIWHAVFLVSLRGGIFWHSTSTSGLGFEGRSIYQPRMLPQIYEFNSRVEKRRKQ